MPKVSVIVASYNGERFVAETMVSLIGQTFRDLEIVVIDDGSTDSTRSILRGFERKDDRVRIIEKENEGLIRTLNRGIAKARGELIARIDHDDLAMPERIAKQAAFLDANPRFIGVGCLLQNITEDGAPIGKARIRDEVLVHAPKAFPPRQQWLYGPTPMIRADALRASGGYREKFVAAEDRDLCWRLGDIGALARLPEVLVKHRIHGSNMSKLKRRTQLFSALLSDLSAIARSFGLDDSGVMEAIDVGGDYAPALKGYRALIGDRYPVESYILYYQMRSELWDVPGFPDRNAMAGAVARHVASRPWEAHRLTLARKAVTYLNRKPREETHGIG